MGSVKAETWVQRHHYTSPMEPGPDGRPLRRIDFMFRDQYRYDMFVLPGRVTNRRVFGGELIQMWSRV